MIGSRVLMLGLMAGLSSACNASWGESAVPMLTVSELEPRIHELDGARVRVAGYLGQCAGYDCQLYRSKADFEIWERAVEAVRQSKKTALPDVPSLAIGAGKDFEFDAEAAPFAGSYVVITGKVTDACRQDGRPVCTDRGPDLNPTDISTWRGESAPAAKRGASPS